MKFKSKKFLLFLFFTNILLFYSLKDGEASFLKDKGKYTIQVLSTTDKEYAEKLVKQLKEQGVDAYLKKIKENKAKKVKKAYRVRIGQFLTEKEAEAYAESVISKKGINSRVVMLDPAKKKPANEKDEPPVDEDKVKPEIPDCSSPVTKVFKYQDELGVVHITNSTEKVPEKDSKRLIEVSVFPVCFSSFNLNKMILRVETDGRTYKVRLKDIKKVLKNVPRKDINNFWAFLKKTPLRLKYRPVIGEYDGIVNGMICFRSGSSIGLEMVKRGIAEADMASLEPFMKGTYLDAEKHAKELRTGAWAVNN